MGDVLFSEKLISLLTNSKRKRSKPFEHILPMKIYVILIIYIYIYIYMIGLETCYIASIDQEINTFLLPKKRKREINSSNQLYGKLVNPLQSFHI